MKRVIALLLVVIVSALIFSGCEYTLTTDLSSIMTEINKEYSYDNMNILKTKDELNQFYLVEKDDVASFAAEFSTGSSYTTEMIFVEAVDEESAENVALVLNNYYRTRVDMANTYDDYYAHILTNCSVNTKGRYVSLVISEKAQEIEELYNSYFE